MPPSIGARRGTATELRPSKRVDKMRRARDDVTLKYGVLSDQFNQGFKCGPREGRIRRS